LKARIALITAAAGALAFAPAAAAHVTANPTEAPAGDFAMVKFRVPHGCEESPTTSLTIQIPEGVVSVTPEAVPGWRTTTEIGELAEPVEVHGETVTEGVRKVTWTGGPLDPHQFVDFGLSMMTPDAAGETIYFPAVQRCEQGQTRWIQIPVEGEEEPEAPAPGVTLVASSGGHGRGSSSSDGAAMEESEGDASEASAEGGATAAPASSDSNDGNGLEWLAVGLGGAGLAAGLTAVGMGRRSARQ
jgi:periplasmic copper chaperone A